MVKRVFFFTLAISFGLSACNILDRSEENVAITVGERNITTDELKRDIKYITSGMGVTDQEVNYVIDPLVSKLVDHYLILEYGRQNGITVSEKELEIAVEDIKKDYPEEAVFQQMLLQRYLDYEKWKEGLKQQLLVHKIMSKASENITPVTFLEIKTYFDTHRNQFMRPQMVKFSQIVTRTKDEAEDIRKRLKKGENLDDLAKKYSSTPEAENGGEVGWVSKGELHESIEKAIFSLPIGRISRVTKTPYGYHIFKVQSKRPKGFKSLSEAMNEIESELFRQKQEAFHERWLIQLKGLFPVQINKEALAALELG
jgi:peptidyl-prolyl cis-trans isomerase C